ncbi:MAG TPA: nitrophenyl compound nitroreductase subunit ArsF family protein [Candidatus Hydrogenedentes bacterium]|nr:nitrophenyl compound nitroreductase subunit ArsF family protein [Candidatus Hydrogenedentota bacterium]
MLIFLLGGLIVLLGFPMGCTKASAPSQAIATGNAPAIQISYFHRTVRCPSCIKIEELAKQTVEETFGGELAAGRMAWRSLNLDDAENAHFEKDYKLTAQSVVVSEMRGDKEIRWKNLEKVWDLLEDDLAFKKYVQDEVRSFSETS